ncbi:FAD/NAD-P-binding domain-containing protein [Lactarius vividus]|nr:FAD/NAD-P-binding domain-containing protein [Lactarius vividus]
MVPLKLAIIGGGPLSFYVASRLLSIFPQSNTLSSQLRMSTIDYRLHADSFTTGVLNYPEKNCTHNFDQAAKDPHLCFFENVLHHTHLLFSTGCAVPTLHTALPPSDRIIPALSLVHWYTQHPSRPAPPPLQETKHVSIIGQGNVARPQLTPPAAFAKYDVPVPVLDVRRRSAVPHVSIIGRCGPLQAAFTKELRELTALDGTSMLSLAPELRGPLTSDAKPTRQQSRLLQLLQQQQQQRQRQLALTVAHSALDASASARAVPTGEHTDLVVIALGHHADPAAAYVDPGLGHLRTWRGRRVLDAEGRTLRRVYASGWAATGARGVLVSTVLDAESILADHDYDADAREAPGAENSDALIADDTVDLESVPVEVEEGWKKTDAEEVRRGTEKDKEHERMDWEEVHDFLTSTGAWQSQS